MVREMRDMRVTSWLAALLCLLAAAAAAQEERTGGPFVPTPQAVVDEMLKMADVREDDFVIDLGSGDGRIVLTAARRYKARGMGVDIDGELVDKSNAEARRDGLDQLVSFHKRDVMQTDISGASVLTLYLLPSMMQALRSKILTELKPGSRVVSHDFEFGEWLPDRKISVDAPDKYGAGSNWTSSVMLWVVPARVEGTWRLMPAGNEKPYTVTLKQSFQHLRGEAARNGQRIQLKGARLEGNRISFVLPPDGARAGMREFHGVVEGDEIRGGGTAPGSASWTARRVVTAAQAPRR
jgi:hypothetical protein